jgi:hypothetical protein
MRICLLAQSRELAAASAVLLKMSACFTVLDEARTRSAKL